MEKILVLVTSLVFGSVTFGLLALYFIPRKPIPATEVVEPTKTYFSADDEHSYHIIDAGGQEHVEGGKAKQSEVPKSQVTEKAKQSEVPKSQMTEEEKVMAEWSKVSAQVRAGVEKYPYGTLGDDRADWPTTMSGDDVKKTDSVKYPFHGTVFLVTRSKGDATFSSEHTVNFVWSRAKSKWVCTENPYDWTKEILKYLQTD